jgi:excisionase family DNA binding protein
MYKKQLIIETISTEELANIFRNVLDEKLTYLKPTPKGELLTQKEAAVMLKVSTKTIYNWIQTSVLPAYTCGNRTYLKSEDIENSLVRKEL